MLRLCARAAKKAFTTIASTRAARMYCRRATPRYPLPQGEQECKQNRNEPTSTGRGRPPATPPRSAPSARR
jgi:hypothetical protein